MFIILKFVVILYENIILLQCRVYLQKVKQIMRHLRYHQNTLKVRVRYTCKVYSLEYTLLVYGK